MDNTRCPTAKELALNPALLGEREINWKAVETSRAGARYSIVKWLTRQPHFMATVQGYFEKELPQNLSNWTLRANYRRFRAHFKIKPIAVGRDPRASRIARLNLAVFLNKLDRKVLPTDLKSAHSPVGRPTGNQFYHYPLEFFLDKSSGKIFDVRVFNAPARKWQTLHLGETTGERHRHPLQISLKPGSKPTNRYWDGKGEFAFTGVTRDEEDSLGRQVGYQMAEILDRAISSLEAKKTPSPRNRHEKKPRLEVRWPKNLAATPIFESSKENPWVVAAAKKRLQANKLPKLQEKDASSRLEGLPPEVLEKIALNLAPRDLLALGQASRTLHDLAMPLYQAKTATRIVRGYPSLEANLKGILQRHKIPAELHPPQTDKS